MRPLPLEPAHRRYLREALVKERRDKLRVQLEKAVRTGNDVEVGQLLQQLGPMAVDELDRLDDRGVAPGNWGVKK